MFRLAFTYDPNLVDTARNLPFASFDGASKTWTTRVCAQTLSGLRRMYNQGLVDLNPDDLLHPDEDPQPAAEAVLRAGTSRRPYLVHLATRDSALFPAFRALPGAQWEKKQSALSFPAAAGAALCDMVDRGRLDDPDKLLATDGVSVAFDGRTGRFVIRGDARAASAFDAMFPLRDVVAEWQAKNLPVAFLDRYTEQMYRGELARAGEGFQPDGIKIDLLPYQKQTVAIALERPGMAVFDAPGLGKTVQGIATGYELLRRGLATRVVVVVPAAVRTQWAAEIVKFTPTDPTDIVVVRGDRKQRAAAYEAADGASWLVVHYDVLARDLNALSPLFTGAFVIADEAHRVKSYTAARTKALRTLARRADRRMALTGTPVETHPGEWFEVLSGFACPGALGEPFDFNERYRWKARFGGYEGAKNLHELRERSRPFYVRRTKSEVATHLPPLMVSTQVLDPSPAYEAALRRAHSEAVLEIREARLGAGELAGADLMLDEDEDKEKSDGVDMTAVGQLRLLCSSPRLISDESAAGRALIESGLVPDEDGPKVDEVRTLCAELRAAQEQRLAAFADADRDASSATRAEVIGERIVLFTFSKRMADLLSERLTEDGVNHVMFTGGTSSDARDAAVAAFTDPTSDVIAFVATDAAAEGLNLGACCSTLINVDLPWTPSRLTQRSQRIHRLDGQAAHYQVTNLIVGGTMEHGVLRLLEARSDMADALFGESGGRHGTLGNTVRTAGRGRRDNVALEALQAYADTPGAVPARPLRARKVTPKPDPVPAPAADGELTLFDTDTDTEQGSVKTRPQPRTAAAPTTRTRPAARTTGPPTRRGSSPPVGRSTPAGTAAAAAAAAGDDIAFHLVEPPDYDDEPPFGF